jgi:Flp pilus assembly pilin Flp
MGELSAFLSEEDGVAVVEIVLILLVLIALVLLFKEKLTSVLKEILGKVRDQSGKV